MATKGKTTFKDKVQDLKGKALRKESKSDSGWAKTLDFLQQIGKALVFPIAILPIAGLLNRLGVLFMDPSVFGDAASAAGSGPLWWIGGAMHWPAAVAFDNLPLLFAISIGFSFSKDKGGESALIAFFGFLAFNALLSSGEDILTYTKNPAGDYILNNPDLWDVKYGRLPWLIYGGIQDTGILENLLLHNVNPGAFGGIVVGLTTAGLYNRYSEIKLPQALSFFSGKRFVPMVTLFAMIPLALSFAIVWPWLNIGLMEAGTWMAGEAAIGAAIYAFLNRLLIPFGLHNATINPILWFQNATPVVFLDAAGTAIDISLITNEIKGALGDNFISINATTDTLYVAGDINTYLALGNLTNLIEQNDSTSVGSIDTSAGTFQTGFFPVMMFGVPAISIAMGMNADKSERKAVMTMFAGAGAVSFLTGVTEPVEFAFMFISPQLYLIHAVFSGVISGITVATGMQLGFGFSAGLIDYAISIPTSLRIIGDAGGFNNAMAGSTGWLWIIGPATAALYFVTFYYGIQFFNTPTQGRTPYFGNKKIIRGPIAQWNYEPSAADKKAAGTTSSIKPTKVGKLAKGEGKYDQKAKKLALLLKGNVTSIDNCATRLRLKVKDSSKIQRADIKALGFIELVTLTKSSVQVIVGPDVQFMADALKKEMNIK